MWKYIIHWKQNLTMHIVSAKFAKLTRSEAEWRRIGLDDDDEFVVAEYRRMKAVEEEKIIA